MSARARLRPRESPISGQVDRLSRSTHRSVPSAALAGGMGVLALAVEVAFGAYGHGTHLLLFLLTAVLGSLIVGPRAGFAMLSVGAGGAVIASVAGLGPSDPASKVVVQLGLYLGVGVTMLLVLDSAVAARRRAPAPPPIMTQALIPEALTPREREVLMLAASGMNVHDLAELLFVSPNTVKTHLSHAYGKLDARNRAQAVRAALHCGCIVPTDICPHRGEGPERNASIG